MTDETTSNAPDVPSDENDITADAPEGEGGFTEEPVDGGVTGEYGEDSVMGEEDEDAKSIQEETPKPAAPGQAKGILEYDLADMYPEVSILVGKPRREWNYHDPEVIRAMWLESKTNAITEWKIRNAKLDKARQAEVEISLNHTAQLRIEYLKHKEEQKKAEFRKIQMMLDLAKTAPYFQTVQMATTTTTEMRYKFNRNNPPVPTYYINHYDKYKKPPFKTKVGRPCKQDE